MATINRFEDLEIWQEASRLAKEIHFIAVETGLKSDFKLKEQVKASSGSVMDNIAEGFEETEILSLDSFFL
jgi:four helix bundle protein